MAAWRTFASTAVMLACSGLARAQQPSAPLPASIQCAPFGQQPLIKIPEIRRDDVARILRAVLLTADEPRNLWSRQQGGPFSCAPQFLRYYKGYRPGHPEEWNTNGYKVADYAEPIPGPTLRARVGDLIEISFLNQIQSKDYGATSDGRAASIDRGEQGLGCDETRTLGREIYPGSDTMPNCIHGSTTSNIHFHGTHTTPSTTGDNVLIQVRPSIRKYPPEPNGTVLVTEDSVRRPFAEFFKWCEANGSPTRWEQLPRSFRDMPLGSWATKPGGLSGAYDSIAAYKLAALWPPNQKAIQQGAWPTFFVGAFPYCFRVPEYDPSEVKMGQAPGTHWYHAHKHGSTEINVANGMSGALIIEGDYDDKLRAFYQKTGEHRNWGLEEQVMVVQQLSAVPGVLSSVPSGPPALSVNGRQRPIVTMRPGQVQLWRIVNSASRNMVSLCPPAAGFSWRQTAQDGVQFSPTNYDVVGAVNKRIDLASANRADLLVQASTPGEFALSIVEGVQPPKGTSCAGQTTLITVRVDASLPDPPQPSMPFIDAVNFPTLPKFLEDIPASEIKVRRELVFDTVGNGDPPAPRTFPPTNSHYIDDQQFADHRVDQVVLLGATEEWKVMNASTVPPINHPFHIHVNPFQITEVFDPSDPSATSGPCAVDPLKPETWKPCKSPTKDFVWWDVFAIPAGRSADIPPAVCTEKKNCPEPIRRFVECSGVACSVTIPGYFKMRSRFVDYTGEYVLHCHILIHEDRGMMQLIQVVPNTTIHRHH